MKFRKVRLCDLCSIVTDYVANGSFKTLADKVKYLNEGYARVIRLVDYNNKIKKIKDKEIFLWTIHNNNELEEIKNKFSNIGDYYIIKDKKE